MDTIHFVAISGSLRKGSYNTSLLRSLQNVLPENTTLEIIPIADLPIYNADDDLPIVNQRPTSVNVFRELLSKADAFIIASPEYNHSIPGGLKNAIDWASRGKDSPLLHKPVSLMGATPGMWGTARMQLAFLPVFLALNMQPVYSPEILIAQANKKFNEDDTLNDAATIDLIRKNLEALKGLVLKQRG